MTDLSALVEALQQSRGIAHKRDIAAAVSILLPSACPSSILIGDDCAAIPDGDGWLLFAIEGFLNEFLEREPWFAGYCGVMVNLSDIYAMGGRPIAVVDAIWSRDTAHARPVLEGLAAASRVYGVPVVGGHSNARGDREQLSVAVLGRARALLTSFDARAGDVLLVVIDHRGAYHEPSSNWDASTGKPGAQLREDLEILPGLAEAGLCRAAKDISMAGVLGTALMLLECSRVGALIDVSAIPCPAEVTLARWLLSTFPSFGFILAVAPQHVEEVIGRFKARTLPCAAVGRCDDSSVVRLCDGAQEDREAVLAWDFRAQPLIGCAPATASPERRVLDELLHA